MNWQRIARAAQEVDGVAPFNEATTIALRDGAGLRIELVTATEAAVAVEQAPVELVVHPDHRRRGHGRALLDRLLVAGEDRFWAHGDLPGAQALAASAGLSVGRILLVLRQAEDTIAEPSSLADTVIRPFAESDVDQIIEVNARAFAHHPEQGAMDRADFDRRRAESWFDPAGLFVAERDGRVIGFHWTKREADLGEVYVVGVDPDHHGGGLGRALTSRGLRHLWDQGVRAIDLYVEGDNAPALAVYRRLGFVEHARDVLYLAPR